MYKAGVSNSAMCETCPSLSEARDPGSGICECIPPNSRGGGDGPETGCEGKGLSLVNIGVCNTLCSGTSL